MRCGSVRRQLLNTLTGSIKRCNLFVPRKHLPYISSVTSTLLLCFTSHSPSHHDATHLLYLLDINRNLNIANKQVVLSSPFKTLGGKSKLRQMSQKLNIMVIFERQWDNGAPNDLFIAELQLWLLIRRRRGIETVADNSFLSFPSHHKHVRLIHSLEIRPSMARNNVIFFMV